jgi:hypothetical protein
MRLRIHDDGAIGMQPRPGAEWLMSNGTAWSTWVGDEHVQGSGWHEALVLPVDDTGARRLAEAWWIAEQMSTADGNPGRNHVIARAVLRGLAEGGER